MALAAARLTFPVSSPPIAAASVATTIASLGVEPVEIDEAAALAPTVVKLEKTKSAPASEASSTDSERVISTLVVDTVRALRMEGPTLSEAAMAL